MDTRQVRGGNEYAERPADVPFPPPSETVLSSELVHLFQSFRRCLELRDKYTRKSCQRLGDNPKDYDGYFQGLEG